MSDKETKDFAVLARATCEKPDISIIVPIYNKAHNGLLDVCLNSLISQGADSIEIICIDDASTDASVDVALEYARKDNRITVLQMLKNSRQGAARNRGISFARGRYLGFVDSDDYVSHNYYEALLREADGAGADMVEAPVARVNEAGSMIADYPLTIPLECLQEWGGKESGRYILSHPHIPACLFARSVFAHPEMRFPEGMLYEDTPLLAWLMVNVKKISQVEDCRYFYRKNDSSTTATTGLDAIAMKDRMLSSVLILDNAKSAGIYESYKPYWDYYYLQVALLNTLDIIAENPAHYSSSDIRVVRDRAVEEIAVEREIDKNIIYRSQPWKKQLAFSLAIKHPVVYCWLRRLKSAFRAR